MADLRLGIGDWVSLAGVLTSSSETGGNCLPASHILMDDRHQKRCKRVAKHTFLGLPFVTRGCWGNVARENN